MVDANRSITGGWIICGGGGLIAAIEADRAEMALTRAVLSTVCGGFSGAGIMGFAVAEKIPATALLG